MLTQLTSEYLDSIIDLQSISIENGDPFTPSSRQLYQRAFMFQNFIYGIIEEEKLIGYCNCSIPTQRARVNLGRNIVSDDELDKVGHINTILVAPQFRRMGYGGLLLSSVVNHFKEISMIKYIFTTIQTINIPSYNLFLKYEFQTLKTFENKDRVKYLLELVVL